MFLDLQFLIYWLELEQLIFECSDEIYNNELVNEIITEVINLSDEKLFVVLEMINVLKDLDNENT